ncbi:hypothetical protein FGA82_26140 [Pseudomonas fluorescens]|uniref:hypothetical protein n=1 Tax=Pseudomonas fluorescens TaxID=294 RepID=UPI0011326D6A|nr:hypothetical protein [Pseudomonas fluorescens]TMU71707.1 hypothetical protein FGA82_26140 [Pseudomonas fluorescens]
MLDCKKNDHAAFENTFDTYGLTRFERRLIDLYRRLSQVEQQHLRRVAEILAVNPKEPVGG